MHFFVVLHVIVKSSVMKKIQFFILVLSMIFSSCASEQLVIARYIKEYKETNTKKVVKTTTKVDHYDVDEISSKVADISYHIDVDNHINATLYMENGKTLEISVANGLLNDANLIGRRISWYETTPIYKQDTVFASTFDTVFVSNLVCEKKLIKEYHYIAKVYDYVTQKHYKITTDKTTFDALIEVPAYVITDKYGDIRWHANTKHCILWEHALNFKGYKFLTISISPNTYSLKILE